MEAMVNPGFWRGRRVLVMDAGEQRNLRSVAMHGYLTRDGIAPAAPDEGGGHSGTLNAPLKRRI